MRYKVFIGTGFAVGFLAGVWAGRDRYHALMRRVRGIKEHPSVHATAGVLQAQAAGAVGSAKRAVAGTGTSPTTGPSAAAESGRDLGSVNGARPDSGGPPR